MVLAPQLIENAIQKYQLSNRIPPMLNACALLNDSELLPHQRESLKGGSLVRH
jgi:hypothetical protein